MYKNTKYRLLSLIFVSLLLLHGCSDREPPDASEIIVSPGSTSLSVGEEASLTINVSGSVESFEWVATRGTVSDSAVAAVIYTAPKSPGMDNVTVKITGKGGMQMQRSIALQIVEPTSTATPIPSPTTTPTETNTPTPTNTPMPTNTPTATITPSPSPPLPPLASIFSQVGEGKAFTFINEGGVLHWQYADVASCKRSGVCGLRIEYKMTGPGDGGWGVQWIDSKTGSFNASEFNALSFWVRGEKGGETFQVGLKDTAGLEVKIESVDLIIVQSGQWSQVLIPLEKFADDQGVVNSSAIENVNFGFNANHGAGTICIDDIEFVVVTQ